MGGAQHGHVITAFIGEVVLPAGRGILSEFGVGRRVY
jgi:hypothetical protein